jgi:enamine deaminase RidA (YjgF/YER057c/UK114 family)
MTIQHIEPGANLSQAVVYGDLVFTAGIVAEDTKQGVGGQTRQVLAKIDDLLRQAGTDRTRLLKCNIWLADISTWAEMNKEWAAWLAGAKPPVRATVEAKLAGPDYKVEIMVTAARGRG